MENQTKKIVEKIENFPTFFENALKYRTNLFLFYYKLEKSSLADAKLKYAVISSKKGVHKLAVKRNKARRRIRHALFFILKSLDLPAEVAIDVIFMANRSVLSAPWEQLLQEISSVLLKILAEKESRFVCKRDDQKTK